MLRSGVLGKDGRNEIPDLKKIPIFAYWLVNNSINNNNNKKKNKKNDVRMDRSFLSKPLQITNIETRPNQRFYLAYLFSMSATVEVFH